jgi:hypothetical protein
MIMKLSLSGLVTNIYNRKNVADSDKHTVKLWKVDAVNEDDIKGELNDNEMKPHKLLRRYAKIDKNHDMEKIHIIAIVPATTGKCLPTFYLLNEKFLRFIFSTLYHIY